MAKKQKKIKSSKQTKHNRFWTWFVIVMVILINVLFLVAFIKIIINEISLNQFNIDEFIQESKNKQEMNTYYIEAETEQTRIPSDGIYGKFYFKEIYNENLWYSESKEYLQDHSLSPDKYVKAYDGFMLYNYTLIADENNRKIFTSFHDDIKQSDGKTKFNEDLKYAPNTTLKQSIDRNVLANCLIHWYDSTCSQNNYHWDKNEKPIVTKITKDYINIKFSKHREVCVSKRYGIATYLKWQFYVPRFHSIANERDFIIDETKILNLKDKKHDNYKFDYSVLNLPKDKEIITEEELAKRPG